MTILDLIPLFQTLDQDKEVMISGTDFSGYDTGLFYGCLLSRSIDDVGQCPVYVLEGWDNKTEGTYKNLFRE